MKKNCLAFGFLLVISSCATSSKSIVKKYLKASNNYDYEKTCQFLDLEYHENFIDGTPEIRDLADLKQHMEWRAIMEAKSTLISIQKKDSTVITIESFKNLIDNLCERKPRKFQLTYFIKNNKIKHMILDTLAGFHQQIKLDNKEFQKIKEFCSKQHNGFDFKMNAKSAYKLRKCIEIYQQKK